MKAPETIAICTGNAINALTDVIHSYYCGASDRLNIQIRLHDALNQIEHVRKELIRIDGQLYPPAPINTNPQNCCGRCSGDDICVLDLNTDGSEKVRDYPDMFEN